MPEDEHTNANLAYELLPAEEGEELLTAPASELVSQIRTSMEIQHALLNRILERDPEPNGLLAVILETVGNRYIDFSTEVNQACIAQRLKSEAYPSR